MSLPATRSLNLPVPTFTADELNLRLSIYRESTSAPTWAGSAAYLGIPRNMLDACLNGQIESKDKAEIMRVLALHRTHLEAYLEGILTREKGSPAGAQFALKAQMGWEDKISVELSSKPQLSIQVGEELGRLLARHDIVDAEIVEDEDDDWLG